MSDEVGAVRIILPQNAMSRQDREVIAKAMVAQMEKQLLQRLLSSYREGYLAPMPHWAGAPASTPVERREYLDLEEEEGLDLGPVERRRYEIIGPPAGHENCRCWIHEESGYGEIHVRGEHCYLVATRLTDPAFPSWSHPLEPLVFDIGAFLVHLDGDVTTHVLKRVRWNDMQETGSKTPIEIGQDIINYPNIREWLEGLARDIDKHTLQAGMARKKMLDELAGGAECDVIKWQQTHRTPKETLESIRSAGIAIVMSHAEPWFMSGNHPGADTQLGIAFVAICAIGQGKLAIKELQHMGYPCKMLRRGRPDIPALADIDEQLMRAIAAQDNRAYLRILGKHNLVHEDDIPQIEV